MKTKVKKSDTTKIKKSDEQIIEDFLTSIRQAFRGNIFKD